MCDLCVKKSPIGRRAVVNCGFLGTRLGGDTCAWYRPHNYYYWHTEDIVIYKNVRLDNAHSIHSAE